ncbi:hypothetical protein D3C72_2084680 [compost metagenome]
MAVSSAEVAPDFTFVVFVMMPINSPVFLFTTGEPESPGAASQAVGKLKAGLFSSKSLVSLESKNRRQSLLLSTWALVGILLWML